MSYYQTGALSIASSLEKAVNALKQKIRDEAAQGAKEAVAPVAREQAARGAKSAVMPIMVGVGAVSLLSLILAVRR